MSVSIASEGIFHRKRREGRLRHRGRRSRPAEAAPEAATPIAVLLASADAAAGEGVSRSVPAVTHRQGRPNKVGPNLYGIVDRPIASHEGFSYSAAMTEFSKGGTEK